MLDLEGGCFGVEATSFFVEKWSRHRAYRNTFYTMPLHSLALQQMSTKAKKSFLTNYSLANH